MTAVTVGPQSTSWLRHEAVLVIYRCFDNNQFDVGKSGTPWHTHDVGALFILPILKSVRVTSTDPGLNINNFF